MTHYTGQLAKDTSKHLKDLNNISTGSAGGIASQSEQRQWRLQRERLQEDFTNALNKFQAAQRQAAQKEKEVVKKSRNAGNKSILIDLKLYNYEIALRCFILPLDPHSIFPEFRRPVRAGKVVVIKSYDVFFV